MSDDLKELMQSALASYEAAGVSGSEGARAMRGALARIEELERERDKFRTLWHEACARSGGNAARADALASRLREAEELTRRIVNQSDVSDAGWLAKLRKPHLVRMLAVANKDARALLARLEAREVSQ